MQRDTTKLLIFVFPMRAKSEMERQSSASPTLHFSSALAKVKNCRLQDKRV